MNIQGSEQITITRNSQGIPKVIAKNELDIYFGMGYCHAMDRGSQMLLMRILGQGTASEHLANEPEMLEIDRFFRQMNWNGHLESEIEKFTKEEIEKLKAYCEGVKVSFSKKTPWAFKNLLKYKKFDWEISDILLLGRMSGYLTLAQSQGEIERLFIEMVQKDTPREMLEELFPDILDTYDEEILKKIKLQGKIIPDAVKWNAMIAPLMASNNWVVAGKKTQSGMPILSNDPHLEINRIPTVWYEMQFELDDKAAYTATMPGISAMLIGRTKDLSWGATYTFMDAMDSWIEQCKDGKYLKDGAWHDFTVRKEMIHRKKDSDIEFIVYENDHGFLEGNPFEEGYYLANRWSGSLGGADSIKSGLKLWNAKSVQEGMEVLGKLEMSFNWVLADVQGNIGYQMSGLLPIRKNGNNGFVPLIGWEKENDWQGFYPHSDLPRRYNPKEGFIATANENLSQYGKVNPHTITMGSYRADRICKILEAEEKITVDFIKEMHYDTYSLQAEKMMPFIKTLLPKTENGDILQHWDYCYDTDSKGAYLFEQIYRTLYAEVFGKVLGKDVNDFLQNETGVYIDFYANFDAILLADQSKWFGDKTKTEIYREAIEKALQTKAKPWGDFNQFYLTDILLGEKLPKFLGFNKGPYPLPGGRATIHQGQVYKSNGRQTSFAPSFRMVTDMSTETIFTNIAGGVSDKRFSKYYTSDFKNWQSKIYKKIDL
ncbi:penicillin acylase family protein [uncultured Kordia sp.]|uniref:penicillin acylase family protein n=1 Tax=uncultured Kordia sp. TaxID=507699 RepID=UPI00261AC55F|nr:penicillin acylase family protein [uncultured Kordia sp.]